MQAMSWSAWAGQEAARLRADRRWRHVPDVDAAGVTARVGEDDDARPVISFASNDYLGLSRHPSVVAAAHQALDRWGAGTGSARLVAGSRPVHAALETELADWKGAQRALLFPTGFAANLGVLSALGGPGARIFSDQLNHASIVDGCRLARAEVTVFPHGDVGAVEDGLRGHHPAIVVTEAVFSMDGDLAPIPDLVEVCARHGALLVVDEAHAVLGPEPSYAGCEVLRIGTLSKTLGALGGFVAGPAPLVDLVANRARSFVYSTASSPADTAAALAAARVARSAEGTALTARLRARVQQLAPASPSPILPVVLGDEDRALRVSRALLDRGLLVPAIRPPTVPPNTSRLRISLSAGHTTAQVALLAAALDDLLGGVPEQA